MGRDELTGRCTCAFSGSHQSHWHVALLEHSLADAADQDLHQSAAAVAAHQDMVRLQPARLLQQGRHCGALNQQSGTLDSLLSEPPCQTLKLLMVLVKLLGHAVPNHLWTSFEPDKVRVGGSDVDQPNLASKGQSEGAGQIEHALGAPREVDSDQKILHSFGLYERSLSPFVGGWAEVGEAATRMAVFSFGRGKTVDDIGMLEGHFFKYVDPESLTLMMEVWITASDEHDEEEDDYYEVITTQYGPWGGTDTTELVDGTGMIRRCPEFKGRPVCHWLPPRLRSRGLSGKMGKMRHPVTIEVRSGYRGVRAWRVQYTLAGAECFMYFCARTGVKLGDSEVGVLHETSFPMKLPRL